VVATGQPDRALNTAGVVLLQPRSTLIFLCFGFPPELILLLGALALFVISLGESRGAMAKSAALATSIAAILAAVLALHQTGSLLDGAYRVDLFPKG